MITVMFGAVKKGRWPSVGIDFKQDDSRLAICFNVLYSEILKDFSFESDVQGGGPRVISALVTGSD